VICDRQTAIFLLRFLFNSAVVVLVL